MDDPRQTGEPISYVGGLGEPPRRRAWPFVALGLIPVVVAVAAVILWNPIRSLGRSAAETIAPYSMVLSAASWSSDQKIATVPITLSLTVGDVDKRTIEGITLRFTKLDRSWVILDATGGNEAAQINGTSIFFPKTVAPGDRTDLAITMLPTRAVDSEIDVTLGPDHLATAARIDFNGTVLTHLAIDGKVRNPIASDADARLTALYNPQPTKGELAVWQIHVANTGPVTINGVRLRFTHVPTGLELQAGPQSIVLPDGRTVQFAATLPPGGQTVLLIGATPRQSGHFVIPVFVYLGESTQPLSSANGGPPLSIDLTVS